MVVGGNKKTEKISYGPQTLERANKSIVRAFTYSLERKKLQERRSGSSEIETAIERIVVTDRCDA